LGGIAVEMRDGAIINAWAYPSGDFDNSSFTVPVRDER